MRRETILVSVGTGLLFLAGFLFFAATLVWKSKLIESKLETFAVTNEKANSGAEYQSLYLKARDLQKNLIETKVNHWQFRAGFLMSVSAILFVWHRDRTRLKRKLLEGIQPDAPSR